MNSLDKCQEFINTHIICNDPPIQPTFEDLTDRDFGYFHVIKYVGRSKHRKSYWLCQCRCGEYRVIESSSLKSGKWASCGCGPHPKNLTNKHGDSNKNSQYHSLYYIWSKMRDRCNNPKSQAYINYGGRGIDVCPEWDNTNDGYINFKRWAIINGYKKGLSIDRWNINFGYYPDNCRWLTNQEQQYNKRETMYAIIGNYALPIIVWSKITNVPRDLIIDRINNGWSDADAVLTPPDKPKGKYIEILEIPQKYLKFNMYSEFIRKGIIDDNRDDYLSFKIVYSKPLRLY